MVVGNEIKKFLYIDPTVLSNEDKRIGRMLVEVDIHAGLLSDLEISWGEGSISNPLIIGVLCLDVLDVIKHVILESNVQE